MEASVSILRGHSSWQFSEQGAACSSFLIYVSILDVLKETLLEINCEDRDGANELNVEGPDLPEEPMLCPWAAMTNLIKDLVTTPDPGHKKTDE
jgi:hypothetical protein